MLRRKLLYLFLFMVCIETAAEAESSLFGPSKGELALEKASQQNRNEISVLSQRIFDLNERVDGLTTIIEGLNASVRELQAEKERRQTLYGSGNPEDLDGKLSKIRRECVTHKELDELLAINRHNGERKPGRAASSHSKKYSSETKSINAVSLEKRNSASLYSEGVRLFQKHKYSEAEKRFSLAQSKGYKPAASNYYLGEIAYYTKKYSDAVYYYKKSAGIYDQASYIDTLLLHTAISLEKTGDKSQAKVFYQTIIDGYPGKKSARIAKEKLKKL